MGGGGGGGKEYRNQNVRIEMSSGVAMNPVKGGTDFNTKKISFRVDKKYMSLLRAEKGKMVCVCVGGGGGGAGASSATPLDVSCCIMYIYRQIKKENFHQQAERSLIGKKDA